MCGEQRHIGSHGTSNTRRHGHSLTVNEATVASRSADRNDEH
jgi:hypothetical protein